MKKNLSTIIGFSIIAGVLVVGALTWNLWSPQAKEFFSSLQTEKIDDHGHSHGPGGTHIHGDGGHSHGAGGHSHGPGGHSHGDDGHSHGAHAGHAHAGHAHDEPQKDTIELSDEACRNIGLETATVRKGSYEKTTAVPAVVVERQAESRSSVVAHLAGLVSKVYVREGEKVSPGEPLFELELRHDDAVSLQAEFLNQLGMYSLAKKEMTRLQNVASGVIPRKRLVEQAYMIDASKTKLDSLRQSLMLHHLSKEQVAEIERGRKLLEAITIVAPEFPEAARDDGFEHQYHVSSISINRGEGVDHGQPLCMLSDFGRLYVEGQAFEDDVQQLTLAASGGDTIRVVPGSGAGADLRDGQLSLKLLYIADQVDKESRALKFYLELPNQQLEPELGSSESRFVSWKYRPGQRMEVHLPTSQRMEDKIVLPPDAVAIDGPNAFVFLSRGKCFDRHEVHVLLRDKNAVVIETDKKLLGRRIAMTAAYQIHVAIKNASGAGADPHAGHSH